MIHAGFANLINDGTGKLRQKGGVVFGVDEQRFARRGGVLGNVIGRTNALPNFPQLFNGYVAFQRFLYMQCGKSRPNHIGKVVGTVVEYIHFQAPIMSCGKIRIAGTQAGPHNANAFITLLFQPIHQAPDVNDGLPGGINGAGNVAGYGIVGTLSFRRQPKIVIRQAHPQCGNPQLGKALSQPGMLRLTGIPMRQNNDRSLGFRFRRKVLSMGNVIGGVRRMDAGTEA